VDERRKSRNHRPTLRKEGFSTSLALPDFSEGFVTHPSFGIIRHPDDPVPDGLYARTRTNLEHGVKALPGQSATETAKLNDFMLAQEIEERVKNGRPIRLTAETAMRLVQAMRWKIAYESGKQVAYMVESWETERAIQGQLKKSSGVSTTSTPRSARMSGSPSPSRRNTSPVGKSPVSFASRTRR
jgi:hypothetical protein